MLRMSLGTAATRIWLSIPLSQSVSVLSSKGNKEDVHVFDNVARSKSSGGGGASHSMYPSNSDPSGGGYWSGLWSGGAPLAAVCVDPSHAHQVYVVSDYMLQMQHTHTHTHSSRLLWKVPNK